LREEISVNHLAWEILKKLHEKPSLYGVAVNETTDGTTIVDAGINAPGGYEAGRILTEICMGGCAEVKLSVRNYGGLELPSITVFSDHPTISTLGSQYAGWQINEEGYFAVGSGPGRALALKPKKIYEEIKYKDSFDKAVIVLETDKYPPAKLIERLAKDCNILPENLTLILTRTASISGLTQVSGRIVETGIHKLRRLGMDPNAILHAWGCAPIPPVHPNFAEAMARANDAILYGGTACYVVKHDNEATLMEIAGKASSTTSKIYGRPFIEIFKEVGCDFYKIDPDLFAPAVIIINNVKTGNTIRCGKINAWALAESFGFKDGQSATP